MQPMDPNAQVPPPVRGGGSKKSRKAGKSKSTKRKDFKIPLIFAAVLGILAFIFLVVLGGTTETTTETYVVRVNQDVTAYVPLTGDKLEAVPMDITQILPATDPREPKDVVFIGATAEEAVASVTAPAEGETAGSVEGVVLKFPVIAGAVLYKDAIVLADQVIASYPVSADERIISVEALPVRAAGAAIAPGDRVDVVVVSDRLELATTLVEDIPVLYVALSEDALESVYTTQVQTPEISTITLLPADPFPGIYTLAVPEEYSAKLALMQETGWVFLIARPADAATPYLDAEGNQQANSTFSVLETFCPSDLVIETPTVDGGVSDNAPITETAPTVEFPSVCMQELLAITDRIVGSTANIQEGGLLDTGGLPPIGEGLEQNGG